MGTDGRSIGGGRYKARLYGIGKFDSAYLRITIGILCFAACAFFAYLAFRPEKSIKYYPKFMRCKGCLKFYNFSDVKDRSVCPKCGGDL